LRGQLPEPPQEPIVRVSGLQKVLQDCPAESSHFFATSTSKCKWSEMVAMWASREQEKAHFLTSSVPLIPPLLNCILRLNSCGPIERATGRGLSHREIGYVCSFITCCRSLRRWKDRGHAAAGTRQTKRLLRKVNPPRGGGSKRRSRWLHDWLRRLVGGSGRPSPRRTSGGENSSDVALARALVNIHGCFWPMNQPAIWMKTTLSGCSICSKGCTRVSGLPPFLLRTI